MRALSSCRLSTLTSCREIAAWSAKPYRTCDLQHGRLRPDAGAFREAFEQPAAHPLKIGGILQEADLLARATTQDEQQPVHHFQHHDLNPNRCLWLPVDFTYLQLATWMYVSVETRLLVVGVSLHVARKTHAMLHSPRCLSLRHVKHKAVRAPCH